MVDAADHEKLDGAKNELHSLLDKPQLAGIPVSWLVWVWYPWVRHLREGIPWECVCEVGL
jgi:hypothetical protein